jgi:hypothetical protein
MQKEISDFVKTLYSIDALQEEIQERMHDYIDYEQMEDEGIEDESEYYDAFGRGEAESSIHNEILSAIATFLKEPIEDWYYNDKYGDIDEIIYSHYPQLDV